MVSFSSAVPRAAEGEDCGPADVDATRAGAGSCEVKATTAGEALTVARWILQLAAWALAALFVAGFTSVVRRG